MKQKQYQIEQTAIVINEYIKYGANRLTLDEFKRGLGQFGLRLDMKDSLLKYYNTSNAQHYLCATTDAVDETGWSFANINGSFYKNHVVRKTPLYNAFRKWRNDNFCVLKSGHILTI